VQPVEQPNAAVAQLIRHVISDSTPARPPASESPAPAAPTTRRTRSTDLKVAAEAILLVGVKKFLVSMHGLCCGRSFIAALAS
jgi:hypothetical protein